MSPSLSSAPRKEGDLLARFEVKMVPEPNSGCWIWIGATQPRRHGNYGVFRNFRRTEVAGNAHRFAYEYYRGLIPDGLELDHLCRNPQCVNPWHLEAVPRRTNLLRGSTIVALNAAKVGCPRGHPYVVENTHTYVSPKGYRMRLCRECLRTRAAARYRRNLDRIGRSARLYAPRFRP